MITASQLARLSQLDCKCTPLFLLLQFEHLKSYRRGPIELSADSFVVKLSGLSGSSLRRGLRQLETGGLIRIIRRSPQPPLINILPSEKSPMFLTENPAPASHAVAHKLDDLLVQLRRAVYRALGQVAPNNDLLAPGELAEKIPALPRREDSYPARRAARPDLKPVTGRMPAISKEN